MSRPTPRPCTAAGPLLRTIINGRRAFASPRQSNENDRGPEVRSCRLLPVSLDASVNLFAGLLAETWQPLKFRDSLPAISPGILQPSDGHRWDT